VSEEDVGKAGNNHAEHARDMHVDYLGDPDIEAGHRGGGQLRLQTFSAITATTDPHDETVAAQ
jgi:hypothetical protein